MQTKTISSYLYQGFQDDSDVAAFVASYNSMTQGYVDYLNNVGLPIYTQLSGALLDWIGAGYYGYPRPTIGIPAGAIFGTAAFNTVQFGSGSLNAITVNDDIYKRILTWKLQRGDGMYCTIPFLKKRITRFLLGVNGTSPNQVYSPSGNVETSILSPVSTASTGSSPAYMVLSPNGLNAYVANGDANTVSAFAVNSDGSLTLISAIATGTTPFGIAISPNEQNVYVTNISSNTVSAYSVNLDGSLTFTASIATGTNPALLTVDASSRFVYVANAGANNLTVFSINYDGSLAYLTTVSTGIAPYSIAVDQTNSFVYVSNSSSNTISQFQKNSDGTLTATASPISTGTNPAQIVIDTTGRYLYVTNTNSNSISQYSINSLTGALTSIAAPVTCGINPVGIATRGLFVYVTNTGTNSISTLGINSDGSLTLGTLSIPTGNNPNGIVISPSGIYAYTVNLDDSTVKVFTAQNHTIGGTGGNYPAVSVLVTNTNVIKITVHYPQNSALCLSFQQCIIAGVLDLPFKYTATVTIV